MSVMEERLVEGARWPEGRLAAKADDGVLYHPDTREGDLPVAGTWVTVYNWPTGDVRTVHPR